MSKEIFLHERNEKGELLPVDIEIEELGNKKIKILPMTKGEIAELRNQMKSNITNEEQDKQLILKHVIEPKFDEKDLPFFKPIEYGYLVQAIMVASGIPKDKIKEANKNLLTQINPQ